MQIYEKEFKKQVSQLQMKYMYILFVYLYTHINIFLLKYIF